MKLNQLTPPIHKGAHFFILNDPSLSPGHGTSVLADMGNIGKPDQVLYICCSTSAHYIRRCVILVKASISVGICKKISPNIGRVVRGSSRLGGGGMAWHVSPGLQVRRLCERVHELLPL